LDRRYSTGELSLNRKGRRYTGLKGCPKVTATALPTPPKKFRVDGYRI
jgi:hypothetical protein